MEALKEALGATAFAVIGILWTFGGLFGAVIEALRNDLLGVVLAIFIPGYGAVVTVLAAWHAIF